LKLVGDWPRKGHGVVSNFTEAQLGVIVAAAHRRGLRVAIHAAGPDSPSPAVAVGVDSIEHGLFLSQDDLRVLGARGGAWVPTIAAMEGIRETLGTDSSGGRLLTAGLNNVRDVIGIAASHGVQVLGGTDLHLSHGTVSLEAERLEAYGLSAESALAGITDNGYRYFGSDRTFGSGQSADVVVCRADPRHDLTTLRDPSFVMRAGHIIARS